MLAAHLFRERLKERKHLQRLALVFHVPRKGPAPFRRRLEFTIVKIAAAEMPLVKPVLDIDKLKANLQTQLLASPTIAKKKPSGETDYLARIKCYL